MTPSKTHCQRGFRAKVARHIQNGNYFAALNLMTKRSVKMREQLSKIFVKKVRQELRAYNRCAIIPKQRLSFSAMESFDWADVCAELRSGLPCLMFLVTSALKRNPNETCEDGQVGHLMLTLLFTKYPKTFKFYPQWNSLQLFKHGTSHVVSRWVACIQLLFMWYNIKYIRYAIIIIKLVSTYLAWTVIQQTWLHHGC